MALSQLTTDSSATHYPIIDVKSLAESEKAENCILFDEDFTQCGPHISICIVIEDTYTASQGDFTHTDNVEVAGKLRLPEAHVFKTLTLGGRTPLRIYIQNAITYFNENLEFTQNRSELLLLQK